jgi:hypothetical protein
MLNKRKANNTIALMDRHRGTILTRKGGWEIGKGISAQGYSLLDDLLGKASFFQVMMLHVGDRLPEKRLGQWLEATFICLSWPDPRIWCNQMGSFGGALKASPAASICAGIMASDSDIYGPGTVIPATRFIVNAVKAINASDSVADYINSAAKTRLGLRAPGYGRPLAKGDERVTAMLQLAKDLGFDNGPHIETALEIDKYLYQHFDESLNLAGYIMAFLSDQGYSETEIYRIYSLCVSGGIHACYSEAYDQRPDWFLPLRCSDIENTGAKPRSLPEPINKQNC